MNAMKGLRRTLCSFVGEWAGRNQLWLEPGTPVHECEVDASVVGVARGACVAIRYAREEGGAPHEGLLVVRNAPEVGAEDMIWVNSFHIGGQFMRLARRNG
jgi:hypothetical protein